MRGEPMTARPRSRVRREARGPRRLAAPRPETPEPAKRVPTAPAASALALGKVGAALGNLRQMRIRWPPMTIRYPTDRTPAPAADAEASAPARPLVEECPVAITFNSTAYAVLMATPRDLRDFGMGYALTEGIVSGPTDVTEIEIVAHPLGREARIWLRPGIGAALSPRLRRLGPVGCGLCGVESLEAAMRPTRRIAAAQVLSRADVQTAVASLDGRQPLHAATGAAHAAAFWMPGAGPGLVREDVGRHNALDKLAGALALAGTVPESGAVVITSRISVDLVQKAAAIGCPVLIGLSAPSTLAREVAEAAGLTLIGNCRGASFTLYAGGLRPDPRPSR